MSPQTVLIAGGGLLGRLLALTWVQRGARVTVIDPAPDPTVAPPAQHPARAAGWTAAGMLSPTAELECADERVFGLGLASIVRWRDIVATLAADGLPVDLHHAGSLLLAHRGDEGAAQRVIGLLGRKAPSGHAPQRLDADALRALEPDVHGPAHAWLLPHEGAIDTVAAMTALGRWLLNHGVRWVCGAAQDVAPHTVRANGALWRADHVYDARGTGARPDLPVRGVRGEVFWLHAPGVRLGRPVRLLHPRWRVYLVGRSDDRVVVGATEIESADRSPVSLRSALELLSAAHSVLPGLAEARLIHQETNLRPALPDNLPAVHAEPGLTRVNGLFRHGWLIAPALIDAVLDGSWTKHPDAATTPVAPIGAAPHPVPEFHATRPHAAERPAPPATPPDCPDPASQPGNAPLSPAAPLSTPEDPVRVNGAPHPELVGLNLAQALARLGCDGEGVASAVNGCFVPRAQRGTLRLNPGDAITTFAAIVGG